MITPEQIRAGRALINAKQSDLANSAGVSLATLNNIERSIAHPRGKTLSMIEQALNDEGIEILRDSFGVGVRLKSYERSKFTDSRIVLEYIVRLLKQKTINPIKRCVLCFDINPSPHFFIWLNYDLRHIVFDNCTFDVSNNEKAQDLAGIILCFKSKGIDIDVMLSTPDIQNVQAIDSVSSLKSTTTQPFEQINDILMYLPNGKNIKNDIAHIKGHLLNHLL